MAHKLKWFIGISILALSSAFPFVADEYLLHVSILLLIWIVVSVSWNLATLSGQVSFAHPGLFGLTSYAASFAMVLWGFNHIFAYAFAIVIGGLLGLALGAVLLRLREVYFLIGTLAFSFAIPVMFIRAFRMLAERGFVIPGSASVTQGVYPPMLFEGTRKSVFLVFLALAVGSWLVLLFFRKRRSLFLALKAIQEDEVAASACGVNVTFYKLLAFAASSAMLGVAGASYAFYQTVVMPGQAFHFEWGLIPTVMNVVGGVETLLGPLVGTVVLFGLTEVARVWLGEINLLVYGLLLVVIVLLMPQGLMGLGNPLGGRAGKLYKAIRLRSKPLERTNELIHHRG